MKFKLFTHLVLLTILLVSCKQNEEIVVQGEVYSVTFTGFNLTDTLRNTVSAEIKCVETIGKTAKIDVFANDSLISTSTGNNLLLSWNTLTSKDAVYTIKVVASDNAGNKKEVTKKAVVSNALLTIEKEVIIGAFHESADYVITDADGKILNTAQFKKGSDNNTVSIYPTTAFEGNEIHIIRAVKNPKTLMECFLNVKRGTVLSNRIILAQLKYPNKTGPIPFNLENVPAYDFLTVSTDGIAPTYPGGNYPFIVYSQESRVLVQIEKDNKTLHHIFDIPKGISDLTLDASLCLTPSVSKTINLPFSVQSGNVSISGKPYKGFDEQYQVENKKFNGDKVKVYFPDNFFQKMEAIIRIPTKNAHYTNFYLNQIPENVENVDITAILRNKSLFDFQVEFGGQFSHYRSAFINKSSYFQTVEPDFVELLIYGSPGKNQFTFPEIGSAPGFSWFKAEDFKFIQLQLYKYNKPTDKTIMFNASGNLIVPTGVSEVTIADIVVN